MAVRNVFDAPDDLDFNFRFLMRCDLKEFHLFFNGFHQESQATDPDWW